MGGHPNTGPGICEESEGTGSKCSRARPNDPGCVYMIQMYGDQSPYTPPLLYKVGFTNNLSRRKSELRAGNPFTLKYIRIWPVCRKSDAETTAKNALSDLNLNYRENYDTTGGTEWYEMRWGFRDPLGSLIHTVHCEIDEYIDERVRGNCTHPDVDDDDDDYLVDSLTYPNHAPNQASAGMATNYDHVNPQSAGGYHAQRSTKSTYVEKWRQSPSKGNVLHVKYNCK